MPTLREDATRQTLIQHLEMALAQAKNNAPLEAVAGATLAVSVTAYICQKFSEVEFVEDAAEAYRLMRPQLEAVYKYGES